MIRRTVARVLVALLVTGALAACSPAATGTAQPTIAPTNGTPSAPAGTAAPTMTAGPTASL